MYSRSNEVTPRVLASANTLIRRSGLAPADFCLIRNQCFKDGGDSSGGGGGGSGNQALGAGGGTVGRKPQDAPFWYIGQKFFQGTEEVARELNDWFQDPAMISDWLVNQQQRMILRQPLVRDMTHTTHTAITCI